VKPFILALENRRKMLLGKAIGKLYSGGGRGKIILAADEMGKKGARAKKAPTQ